MDILLLSDSDERGGAARGAQRLYRGLQSLGVNAQMLVRDPMIQEDDRRDPGVLKYGTWASKISRRMGDLPLLKYPNRKSGLFSTQWFPNGASRAITDLDPDIVHLNWICNGYLSVEAIGQIRKPIVWTLRDMWAFTGGCHYSESCDAYTQHCGTCPSLKSHQEQDLSRWVWQRKAAAWRNIELTLVTPSRWLKEAAMKSSLFHDRPIEVIHHGLNLQQFAPQNSWADRQAVRQDLGLPLDRQVILFGAPNALDDARKGYQHLLKAIQSLTANGWGDRIQFVVFGATTASALKDSGCPVTNLGTIQDDRYLAMLYGAADVMVVPSEQEAFGHTACEALACGVPVVAFDATGPRDIVDHGKNGYLARPFSAADLARGIAWVLSDPDRQQRLRSSARVKAERAFDGVRQAERYVQLFEERLGRLMGGANLRGDRLSIKPFPRNSSVSAQTAFNVD
jgi:glycosyltransferase involved in cell wall biosynthesis